MTNETLTGKPNVGSARVARCLQGWVLAALLGVTSAAVADRSYRDPQPGWPPRPLNELNGRSLEFFAHGAQPAWGYGKAAREDFFAVVHPRVARPGAPLVVVLHSAGHDLMTCLRCVRQQGNHDIYTVPDDMFGLYVDCRYSGGGDWWWGYLPNVPKSFAESPLEKRILATVAWAVGTYGIDANRVYLCGNSMGGSGTLGIGLRHGDVFAAIKANVPAGVEHACSRIGVAPEKVPEGVVLPDPPVCVDYSSQTDRWSLNHERLICGLHDRKWPYMLFWGAFGHVNDDAVLVKYNDIVHDFDWLSVRKDEPYPVFTDATSDGVPPWPVKHVGKNATDARDLRPGQVNGFFRWRNVSQSADALDIDLYLAAPRTRFPELRAPDSAVADVTLRRLTSFRPAKGSTLRWTFGDRSGTVVADSLVTVPRLTVTRTVQRLSLRISDSGNTRRSPGFVRVEWSEKTGEKWTVSGLAERETGRIMTTNTVFAICSNTKPVASVLALTFVEEGLIGLDDPVSKYFPVFAEIKVNGHPPKRPITLRHLITHTSGLAYGVSAPGRKEDMTSYREKVELAVKKAKMRGEPGEKYQYCGLGFQIMGAVLEKVSGRTVPDLMRERIFEPLGMHDTTFYPDAAMLARTAIPYYHPPKGGAPVRYDFNNRWTAPIGNPARTAMLSGGLFCTVGDYLKFSQMIVRKGLGLNGRRILSEKMFDDYLLVRQTPPGDKVDSSFDIAFNKEHTGGGKGGLFATGADWNWAERSCSITFRAKSPYAPKGWKSELDASGFGGKKTTFVLSEPTFAETTAACRVSNNEDRHGVATVRLLADGRVLQERRVGLAIGESKRVTFDYERKPGGKLVFSVE